VLVVLSTGLYYHSDVHMMCRATRVRYQVARMAKSRETVTQPSEVYERDHRARFERNSESGTDLVKQFDRNGKHAIHKTTPIAPERPLMIE
jgi:hypothetical protein